MDVMDGFEFTKRYREWEVEQNKQIPIIAVTAHIDEKYKVLCLESGMDDYLTKPVRIENLSKILEKWVKNKNH
jgi:CheY-like chemotaxis protein